MNTILLVEDSHTQREKIADLLQGCKFSVITASDGAEALSKITENPGIKLDLVILDVVMPNVNGYEVCRRLKANPKTENIPVIMCSFKGSEADRYWGLKQGADAYLVKPFKARELITTIKHVLRNVA